VPEAGGRRWAAVLGTGRCVPERVVTNEELEAMLGEPVGQWLEANVGIRTRHIMADDQTTSDLAAAAARAALERAGLTPDAVDLIIVATDTPDQPSPATAARVQHLLGAGRAMAFDMNCACAGWVTALDMGARYIATDPEIRHVLVVGAYGMSRFLDWSDKRTCTLFADGAGAAVLGAAAEPGLLASCLASEPSYHDALGIYTGGAARPATLERIRAEGPPAVRFVRRFSAEFNVERWPALIRRTLDKAGLELDDVALFIFTQINLRTIEAVMDVLGLPLDRTHWVMDRWGYTGSACIPMALDDAVEQERLRRGDHVLFCASGGGIAMAAAVVRWTCG